MLPKEKTQRERPSPDQQKTPTEKVQVSTEVERSRPTQPMPKDDLRNRFATEPIVKRWRRSHSGSQKPDRPAEIATSANGSLAETGRMKALDRTAGLVIIGSTMMVMVLYGQAAAVVCFCACLYFTTVLWSTERRTTKEIAGEVDVESKESKKRVVLKGLLERDRRRPKI
ncbi:hypothetical protein HPP92_025763 [Vanilla planifolia]|uniref:Transmembrane protein n=1 Tax=Vanilla planifolia TaxID=51239 RepID=A0A835PJM5_VANPL|nr:hypothetical protein HPP92_025763 [Vanilla planifolia]